MDIEKRTGCDYCLKIKTIMGVEIGFMVDKNLKMLRVFYDDGDGHIGNEVFMVEYCPMCGKKL